MKVVLSPLPPRWHLPLQEPLLSPGEDATGKIAVFRGTRLELFGLQEGS